MTFEKQELNERQTFWHAILHGQRVGHIGVYYENNKQTALVSNFHVNADQREFGIGTNLLHHMLSELQTGGVKVIRVCAMRPETLAYNLYLQHKFVAITNRIFVSVPGPEAFDMELRS